MLSRLLIEHDHIRRTLNLLEIQFLDLCRGKTPDYPIMLSIIVYIQEYPEQAHHPLEDAIFSVLLERTDEVKLIRNLITDHTELETVTRNLRESLEFLKKGTVYSADDMDELKHRLSQFLSRQRRHLYAEEMDVYPLVKRVLTNQDWRDMRAVVPLMDDPVFGERTQSDYERLRRMIEGKSA